MKHYPKFLQELLSLTSHDDKIPTDIELDSSIERLSFHMQDVYPLIWLILKKKVIFFFKYKWKVIFRQLVYISILTTAIYFAWIRVYKPKLIIKEQVDLVSKINDELTNNQIPSENLRFMNDISKLESTCNDNAVKGQYWGAFQLGDDAREECGLASMNKETFLNNKYIQNWAMNEYTNKNYKYLIKTIRKYGIDKGGKKIGNYWVTVSGLLASAHLVGWSKVVQFIESNGNDVASDNNGIPLTNYLGFNGYRLVFSE